MVTGSQEVSLRELLLTLRKNLSWIIISALSVIIIFVLVAFFSPAQYSTSLKIMIELPGEGSDFAFTAFPWYWDPTIVNNEVEVLKTYRISNLIAKNLPSEVKKELLPQEGQTPEQMEYNLSRIVQNMIEIQPVQETNIINIKVYSHDPKIAYIVAETLARVYLTDNLEIKKKTIESVRDFLEVQLSTFKNQLEVAELKLQNYKVTKGAAYLGNESVERIKRMVEFESQLYLAETEYIIKKKNLELISSRIDVSRYNAMTEISSISSPLIEELKKKVVELEVERTSLISKGYEPSHSKIKEIDSQLNDVRKTLQNALNDNLGQVFAYDPKPIYQKDLEDLASLQTEVVILEKKIEELKKIISTYESKMKELPEDQIEISRLTRELEVNEKVYLMLKEKYEEARIKEAGLKGDLRVIDDPILPLEPFKPRRKLIIFMGLLTGIFFGIGMGILKEFIDFRIKTIDDFNKIPEVKLLGYIPKAGKKLQSRNLAEFEKNISKSELVNNFTMIRKNLQLIKPDKNIKAITVTSTLSGAGKSTFAINLAISFSKMEKKVILLDCDFRKPVSHQFFNFEIKPGILDFIMAEDDLKKYLKSVPDYNIDIFSAGSSVEHPLDLLESQKFKNLINLLRDEYDYIILDTPPILEVPDAAILSTAVDCTVLVESAGQTSKALILEAKKILESLNSCLSGVVLNKVTSQRSSYYYKYGSY